MDDDGITSNDNFSGTTTDIDIKNTTHADVQFMAWMQDCKAT